MARKTVLTGKKTEPPPIDRAIAWYANRQHTLVRIDQLHRIGLSDSAVSKRVNRGSLHRRYPGVYSAGCAALSREGEFLAAVFAGREGALLAHEAGAELLGVRRYPASLIDVVAPKWRRALPGVKFHRARNLHSRDRTTHKRIPVTSVPRLLVDLTDSLQPIELANVIHEAAYKGWFNLAATRDAMARANGRHNLHVLQRALEYHLTGSAGAKSRNEVRFLAMIHDAGIPEPRVNVHVHGFEVDFHWPDRKLVIEIDGPGHDRPRTRREDDLRDRVLEGDGWVVLRFPEDQLSAALAAASGS